MLWRSRNTYKQVSAEADRLGNPSRQIERDERRDNDVPRDTAAALIVRPAPPFRLDLTVWALRRRARNKIDRWDGVTYRRVIAIEGRPIEVAVRQEGPLTGPRLIVTATPSLRTPSQRQRVRSDWRSDDDIS